MRGGRPFLNEVQWFYLVMSFALGFLLNGWMGALLCAGFVLLCAAGGRWLT